jgi:hypothetical protein
MNQDGANSHDAFTALARIGRSSETRFRNPGESIERARVVHLADQRACSWNEVDRLPKCSGCVSSNEAAATERTRRWHWHGAVRQEAAVRTGEGNHPFACKLQPLPKERQVDV